MTLLAPAPDTDTVDTPHGGFASAVRDLDSSPRLAQRRFAWLPVTGPGAPHTHLQGRGPGDSTSLAGLGELLSSIAVHGVLSPILVEELTTPAAINTDTHLEHGATVRELRLVTGEGRLRSCRLGLREDPDNPHFQRVPAMICPGPLTDEERNAWQLVENLARQDYQPGELASALLLERCAVLAARLTDAGVAVPVDGLTATDNPVARWTILEKTRMRHAPQVGAPWELVLRRLGVSFGPRKARQLVAAFQHLPRELTADLDAHKIALTTRTGLVRLARDPRQSVTELWTAVKALGRPDLLAAATASAETAAATLSPGSPLPPVTQAITAAIELHEAANLSRAEKLRATSARADDTMPDRDAAPAGMLDTDAVDPDGAIGQSPNGPAPATGVSDASIVDLAGDADIINHNAQSAGDPIDLEIDSTLVTSALESLRALLTELRTGRRPSLYAAGSLTLLLSDLTSLLTDAQHTIATTHRETG